MNRKLLSLLASVSLVALSAAPAVAAGDNPVWDKKQNHPHVQLSVTGVTGQGSLLCSGTIVSDRHVITAAHCFQVGDALEVTSDDVATAWACTAPGHENCAKAVRSDLYRDGDLAVMTFAEGAFAGRKQAKFGIQTPTEPLGMKFKICGRNEVPRALAGTKDEVINRNSMGCTGDLDSYSYSMRQDHTVPGEMWRSAVTQHWGPFPTYQLLKKWKGTDWAVHTHAKTDYVSEVSGGDSGGGWFAKTEGSDEERLVAVSSFHGPVAWTNMANFFGVGGVLLEGKTLEWTNSKIYGQNTPAPTPPKIKYYDDTIVNRIPEFQALVDSYQAQMRRAEPQLFENDGDTPPPHKPLGNQPGAPDPESPGQGGQQPERENPGQGEQGQGEQGPGKPQAPTPPGPKPNRPGQPEDGQQGDGQQGGGSQGGAGPVPQQPPAGGGQVPPMQAPPAPAPAPAPVPPVLAPEPPKDPQPTPAPPVAQPPVAQPPAAQPPAEKLPELKPVDGVADAPAAPFAQVGEQFAAVPFGERFTKQVPNVPVERIAGANRVDTAVQMFAAAPNKKVAVLSTGRSYADGLAGGSLAGALKTGILLTNASGSDPLEPEIIAQLKASGTTDVYITGGYSAIGKGVEDSLFSAGVTTKRLAGLNRFETAELVAETVAELVDKPGPVFVASGANFPDALVASSAAARLGGTVRLVDAAHSYVGKGYCIGGPACAYAPNATKIVGQDRYETAYQLAARLPFTGKIIAVSGKNFPDALAAGAFSASTGATMVLTDGQLVGVPAGTKAVAMVGGASVIAPNVAVKE